MFVSLFCGQSVLSIAIAMSNARTRARARASREWQDERQAKFRLEQPTADTIKLRLESLLRALYENVDGCNNSRLSHRTFPRERPLGKTSQI